MIPQPGPWGKAPLRVLLLLLLLKPHPHTISGRLIRDFVRFYACFSAFWKLDKTK